MTRALEFEQPFFAALNALVEPAVRRGLFSGPVCPLGVISLETTGRRTRNTHRVPVLAISAGKYVLVATARGERSDWFRNIEANPKTRYWLGGREGEARAVVLPLEDGAEELPEAIACMMRGITAHAELLGWRFALLIAN